MDAFPYLGHTITHNNSDWAAVYHNLRKTWQQWGMIYKVLTKTGEIVWACGMLYKVILQMVILNRSGNWVVTGAMLKVLEGLHNILDRRIAGMTAWRVDDGEWEYSPVVDAM